MLPNPQKWNAISVALRAKSLFGSNLSRHKAPHHLYIFFHGWSAKPVCQVSENLSEVILCPKGTHSLRTPQTGLMLIDFPGTPVTQQISCHCGDMCPAFIVRFACVCVWVCLLLYSWEWDGYLGFDVLLGGICRLGLEDGFINLSAWFKFTWGQMNVKRYVKDQKRQPE